MEKEAARQKRKILLLIDNAPSHIYDKSALTWLRVEELEPNMTLHIQPNDAGIIRAFKGHYRRLYLRHVVERDEAEAEDIWHINQLEAMQLAEEAWGIVSGETVANCWKHTRIVTPRGDDGVTLLPESELQLPSRDSSTLASVKKSIELLQRDLDRLALKKIGADNVMSASEMVNVSGEEITEMEWSDNEILDQIRSELNPVAELTGPVVDDDNEEPPVFTPAKALQAIKELQRFAGVQSSKEWTEAGKLLPKLARSVHYEAQEALQQSDLSSFIL